MKELQSGFDGRISKSNSTNAPLAGGAVFTGTSDLILDGGVIIVSVKSDVASATNGLAVQFSPDGTNWDVVDFFNISAGAGKTFTFQPVYKYFRVVYTNGGSEQTYFRLQTQIKTTYVKPSSHRIQDSISDDDDAELTTAVIKVKTPSGKFVNANANTLGNMLVSLQEQKDLFGRLKVSEPFSEFDNSMTCPEGDAIFWGTLVSGTGTGSYQTSRLDARYDMNTSASGDYVVRQTKQRFKYQPGKVQEILATGLLTTETSIRKRIGYMDYDNVGLVSITNTPQNGVFFENNAGVYTWNIVKNGTITESVAQANWNIDKCDGTGTSGFTYNPTYCNLYGIMMEWLGVGSVGVAIANDKGELIMCHLFLHPSTLPFVDVYTRTANLPVAYEITQTGAGSGSMKQICSCVISSGGFNPKGVYRSFNNDAPISTTSGAFETLVGIRLREDYFEYSVDINSISTLIESNGYGKWFLCFNPTYTGTPTRTVATNSILENSVTNLVVTDRGTVLASGPISGDQDAASSDIQNALRLGKDLAGVMDEIWLVINTRTSETANYGFINVRELF